MTTKAIEARARAKSIVTDEMVRTAIRKWNELADDVSSFEAMRAAIESAIASGDLVPASAVAAERKTTPDWGKLVQCVLRVMDHPHKGENSTEQAERIATAIENRFAMDSAGAVAAERERCLKAIDEVGWKACPSRFRDDIRATISALSSETACGGWRDISTAPRDGTPFLAWEDDDRGPFKCWWYENWPSDEAYWMDHACTEPQPTHWQPLPEPPAMLNAATKDGERA